MQESKINIVEPGIEAVMLTTSDEQPLTSEFDTGSFAFENIGLSDILDSANVQAMMDDFYALTKISIGIVDIKGNMLIVSGMQDICLKFHRAVPESCQFCIDSDKHLTTGISPGSFREYRCKNNMRHIATPIMIGDNQIGNLFLAQFFFNDEEVDSDLYRAQAKHFGYDETAYLAALDRVPRFSRESIAAAVGFCSKLANLLSDTNYNKVILANSLTRSRHAIEKLKESEDKYRMIAENTSDGILVFGADNTIRYASPAYLHQLGYNEVDELSRTPDAIYMTIHEDDRDAIFSNIFESIALKENGLIYTYRVKNKTGHYIWREDNANFKYDSAGCYTGCYVITRDITARKLSEQELRLSLERYKFSLQSTGQIGWSVPPDAVVEDIPMWRQYTGQTLEEVKGLKWTDAIHPDDRDKTLRVWLDAVDRKINYDTEYRVRRFDGVYRDFLVRGIPLFNNDGTMKEWVGTCIDITDRKRAEESLRAGEQRYREIFENVPGVFYETDLNGIIKEISPSVNDFFGFERAEMIGTPVENLYYNPEDRALFLAAILNSGELLDYEITMKTKRGELRYALINARLIYSSDCKPHHIIGSILDITERKRAQHDLIFAKEHAEESDRLKTAFLLNISHEIRTPMNGILGFASLLKEPELTGDEQQEYIRIIEKSGDRMLNIINDIVEISKIESGHVELSLSITNITEQIEDVYDLFNPKAEEKGIEFIISNSLSPDKSSILADPKKIYTILANLVKNAIKYTKTGSIELGCDLVETTLVPSLQFSVKDTGIGIPKNRQEAIFERFIQADIEDKQALQGAGLGLSIAKAYVELLGGNIFVTSEEGKGATFCFTIPYHASQQKEEIVTVDEKAERQVDLVKNLSILIVDDDEVSKIYISSLIEKISTAVFYSKTGAEAIAACRENHDIDLVLMDIRMPEVNGYEATHQIRKFNKDVIIIAQTAFGLKGDREKALEAGCNDYISKPITQNIFFALIEKYFSKTDAAEKNEQNQ